MNSNLSGKKIAIFGGNGFIGSHLTSKLCEEACQIHIITRNPKKKRNFFFANDPGQVNFEKIDNYNQLNVTEKIKGCDIVFNLVGILAENKSSNFNFVHEEIPHLIANGCKENKVRNFIHLSALNVNKISDSSYAKSKYKGELKLKESFPSSTIVRPSVVFGRGDNFTNFFSNLSKFSLFLPVIGTPEIEIKKNKFPKIDFRKKVKFQPIYVGDLVKFLISISNKKNKTYDLAGPFEKTFEQIFDIILKYKRRKRIYIPIPFFAANLIAFFLEVLPNAPLTQDQVKLLKYNSVSKKGLQNLKQFVKTPLSLETVIKNYL